MNKEEFKKLWGVFVENASCEARQSETSITNGLSERLSEGLKKASEDESLCYASLCEG